jgi:FtsP/CotA-like multicopper oxidase with cupredoxin domain
MDSNKPDVSQNTPLSSLNRRDFLSHSAKGLAAISMASLSRQYAQSQGVFEVLESQSAQENWNEPWVWKPSDWPGQALHLNVMENESPGPSVGFGNNSRILFAYNGSTPGPTIRMQGNETLNLKVRNLLGEDLGQTPVGPSPDLVDLPPELKAMVLERAPGCTSPAQCPDAAYKSFNGKPPLIPADVREDWCLGEHNNGVHSTHVTNFHTHGLHVRPGTNPDGTHSDNVILRILSQGDFKRRETAEDPRCRFLLDNEQAGEANYEFRLGDVQKFERRRMAEKLGIPYEPQVHPPGTHWYHPHSHGSTHNQVSSGMAGFLIVEGQEDKTINRLMTGNAQPNIELKSGDWDYRERLMLVQRVLNTSKDPDGATSSLRSPTAPLVNGNPEPTIITMRLGAVERWRILNGSVDGRGYKRIMVLKGQYCVNQVQDGNSKKLVPQLQKYDATTQTWNPASLGQVEADKQHLFQMAMDGVTFITQKEGQWRFHVKDLAQQNAGSLNPLAKPFPSGVNPNSAMLDNFEACFKVLETSNGIRDCWVRPNEVYMAPANRADVFFKAPEGGVFTLLAKSVIVHADNYQSGLQKRVTSNNSALNPFPEDIVMAYVAVSGKATKPFDMNQISDALGELPVPQYQLPPTDEELVIGETEAERHNQGKGPNVKAGQFRTRRSVYSGWGNADFPLFTIPDSYVDAHPELKNLTYSDHKGTTVLMTPDIRTMAINGRKFSPNDPEMPSIMADSAEEWGLFNSSMTCWADKGNQPSYQYNGHLEVSSLPTRAQAQSLFRQNHRYQIASKAVDHPFHIHTNPFWVMRIDIPDENGVLRNILDEPRWQDVIWIPRNGGRIVFRQRYPDYLGLLVHHCHLLLHEDNGMMTGVTVTHFAEDTNYAGSDAVVHPGDSPEVVNLIHTAPTPSESFEASAQFKDSNHFTGQVYPGFPIQAPPEGLPTSDLNAVHLNIEFVENGSVKLWWQGNQGDSYTLQTASDAKTPDWQNLDTVIPLMEGKIERTFELDLEARIFRLIHSPA